MLDVCSLAHRFLSTSFPWFESEGSVWVKVKAGLRRVPRALPALHEALGPALACATAQEATGFLRHSGYNRHLT